MKLLLILIIIIMVKSQGLSMLNFSPSARSSASASNGVSFTGSTASSMHFNPSSFVENPSEFSIDFHFMRTNVVDGQNYIYLASRYALDQKNHLGLGLRYYSKGRQELLAENEVESNENFSPYDYEISLAYSRKLTKKINLGLKASLIKSVLVPENILSDQSINSPSILSYQLSAFYAFRNDAQTTIGLSLSNFGNSYQYTENGFDEELPKNLQIGISSSILESSYGRSSISLEYRKMFNQGEALGINVNQEIYGFLELHLGYVFDDNYIKNKNYLTNGISLKKNNYQLSFSYQFMSSENGQIDPFDGTWNLSFQVDLGLTNPNDINENRTELVFNEEKVSPETIIAKKEITAKPIKVKNSDEEDSQKDNIESPFLKELVVTTEKELNAKKLRIETYKVQANDNLWNLAEKYLGDGFMYKDILVKNIGRISNEDLIETGQEIVILQRSNNTKLKLVLYHVNEGETLKEIAKKLYKDESRWENIYKWNDSVLAKDSSKKLPNMLIKIIISKDAEEE
jgi:LysM repeat protein